MYIFSDTDPAYLDNLRYFVSEAVAVGDRCDYVFVIQVNRSCRVTGL